MSVFSLAPDGKTFDMPSLLIVWTVAGEAQTEERELGGRWVTRHIRLGSSFLTIVGDSNSYWKRLSAEPLEAVMLLLGMQFSNRHYRNFMGERA